MMSWKCGKTFFRYTQRRAFTVSASGKLFPPIVTFGWLLLQKLERDLEKESAVKLHTALFSFTYPLSMCFRTKKFLFLLLRFVSSVHALHIYAIYGLVEYHLQRERFYGHLQLLLFRKHLKSCNFKTNWRINISTFLIVLFRHSILECQKRSFYKEWKSLIQLSIAVCSHEWNHSILWHHNANPKLA